PATHSLYLHDALPILTVAPREIVVIVGPNGAGKSTAMKAIFGLLKIRGGRVLFDGDDITGWAPNRIVQRGICYVPQVDNVFREIDRKSTRLNSSHVKI